MKIEILQVSRTPDEMLGKHGDYDDLFKRIIEPLTSADYTERFEELFKFHRSARDEI